MKTELIQYLQQQIATNNERLRRFTHDLQGEEHPKRFLFDKLKKYLDDFFQKKVNQRLIIIPGFRGVGKTTLMAQLAAAYSPPSERVLFLSVEDAKNLFDVGIAELLSAYEHILGDDLASIKEPILFFLDEIQSDPQWAKTLKSFYEKTTNVFFCCTGSAAVVLQTTTDLARRAIFEKLPPLSFREYQMIKNKIFAAPELPENIRQALYFSKDAAAVFNRLKILAPSVNQYWSRVKRYEIREYLSIGTLPFALTLPQETAVYDAISLLLDKIVRTDLPLIGNFDTATLGAVKRILFAIAENDTTSLSLLAEKIKINRLTIANIFDALEKAEVLIKVPAHGSNMIAAKKPNKYLFMSPAIRMSFFYFTGQESTYLTRQGKLLEDAVAAHLYQEFILNRRGVLRYDSAQGGADFILQILNNKQIIIEVGRGEKDKKQIASSLKKIKSDYNLIFSDTELKIDHNLQLVFVPWDYYFLM